MITPERLLERAADLSAVAGVSAVTGGGSRARGTHRPDSDVDLGVYYERGRLDARALEVLAERWGGAPVQVARPGGWGPWVDGGAWLTVDDAPVDWILRDLDRVREQCARAIRGEFAFFAQPGHPLGFLDVAYAGEVATAVLFGDPEGVLAELRDSITPYPSALRDAMLGNTWQVDFLLDGAAKGAKKGDTSYVALCAAHAVMLLAHAWHAAAGEWVTNEKGLVLNVAQLGIETFGFTTSATRVLGSLGHGPGDLARALGQLRALPRPDAAR